MIDEEVVRLRRLRGSALQLREVARTLSRNQSSPIDVLLRRGGCAAWRIARTVTGRLRAHPNDRYQRDASLGLLFKNSVVAAATSLTASSRPRAMSQYGAQLKLVMRELDHARAFAWAADLSDAFGRSQRELRALLAAVSDVQHSDGRHTPTESHGAVPQVNAGSSFLTI